MACVGTDSGKNPSSIRLAARITCATLGSESCVRRGSGLACSRPPGGRVHPSSGQPRPACAAGRRPSRWDATLTAFEAGPSLDPHLWMLAVPRSPDGRPCRDHPAPRRVRGHGFRQRRSVGVSRADHRHDRQDHRRSTRPAPTTTARSPYEPGLPVPDEHPYGSPDVQPDIATSASFTSPTEYTVKLKPGLKFANGHDLTSSDVKFTFDRQLKINDPNGPASLLGNLASTAAPDPTTVVFHLKAANDQTFAQVLVQPGRPDRRRAGLLGRQAHAGRRHRQGQRLRRPVRRSPATTSTT